MVGLPLFLRVVVLGDGRRVREDVLFVDRLREAVVEDGYRFVRQLTGS